MAIIESPLRYPGGKTQLTPFVLDLMKANGLNGGVYAEPFAGGAGIAWRLLLNGDASEVWINDINPALYAFWDAVVNNPDPLVERIMRTKVTVAEWHRQREVILSPRAKSLDMAFATFFLNRTNRSGIIKGGMIGGFAQNGEYKLDCRFNREDLVEKIERIHKYRDVIRITKLDAKDCLRKWAKALPKRGLINIDPPYYEQGRDLYLSFYTRQDHAKLARLVRSLKAPWMLTYDDVPQIETLYNGLPMFKKSLTYYAQVKRKASELLVLSPWLNVPLGLKASKASRVSRSALAA
jgi:DNA adenine methylase